MRYPNRTLFFILSVTIFANCLVAQSSNDKVKNLKQYYQVAFSTSDSIVYKTTLTKFFNEFPNSFDSYYSIYYWNEKKNVQAPLYDVSEQHLNLLLKYGDVNNILLIDKLCKLSINGRWEADAINFLQNELRNTIKHDLFSFSQTLNKYNEKQIVSLWKFYFDGPVPLKRIPKELNELKRYNNKMYKIMVLEFERKK